MYESDSFFTLTPLGQAGLLVLSLALFFATLYGAWRLASGKSLLLRLLIGMALFFVFTWASPQVYYQYYRMIIEGLPQQLVIKAPPSALEILKLLTFQAEANLSAHSKGALGWALMVLPAFRRRS